MSSSFISSINLVLLNLSPFFKYSVKFLGLFDDADQIINSSYISVIIFQNLPFDGEIFRTKATWSTKSAELCFGGVDFSAGQRVQLRSMLA